MKTNAHLLIISRSVLLTVMFQSKVVEKIKAQILCSEFFFSFENRAVCVIMLKNIFYVTHAVLVPTFSIFSCKCIS